ncbi:MAG: 6-phosphogluconate dehydrogenase, decarboxylating [Promethearchaeota archaeon]|nr:MAG: 6-phosphogluconate dehydrogenase, decarboxylating [Candidatus Lokiarchaeota archaeon]
MELGIIGLGKMGGNISLQCIDKGIKVVGKDPNPQSGLEKKGVIIAKSYEDLANNINTPRVIFLSLPAGNLIDKVIDELAPHLDKGDVLLDGGNSYYKDSQRRAKELKEKDIYFIDCGTSGGTIGAREGASFMIGGDPEGVKLCEPILRKLSVDGGYIHCGPSGSGHFVKLVHNGIEFGMLQAIGEGVQLLNQSEFKLDLKNIFEMWSHGTVIRSWLVELMAQGLEELDNIEEVPPYIEDTGEVNWLVQEAINKEIPIPVITQSVIELFKSRKKPKDSYRAVAIMRHGFGGHPYGESDYLAKERKTSRIYKL